MIYTCFLSGSIRHSASVGARGGAKGAKGTKGFLAIQLPCFIEVLELLS